MGQDQAAPFLSIFDKESNLYKEPFARNFYQKPHVSIPPPPEKINFLLTEEGTSNVTENLGPPYCNSHQCSPKNVDTFYYDFNQSCNFKFSNS